MNDAETKATRLDEFERLQDYISNTDENQASYQIMVSRYRFLKALLTDLGMNLTDIDKLKL